MDPLEILPTELSDLILNELDLNSLLNATLVSKFWHTTIGSSAVFKHKVELKITNWMERKQDLKMLKKNSRDYERVSIRVFKYFDMLEYIGQKGFKEVFLSIGKVSSQRKFVKIMDLIPAVRKLKIFNTMIRELTAHRKVELQCCETLVFSDVALDLFDIFMIRQPYLKELSLRFITCDLLSKVSVGQSIVNFLLLNEQIQKLETYTNVTNELFTMNISENLHLNLKSLLIGLSESSPQFCDNIQLFLKSQSSLQDLQIIFDQNHEDYIEWPFDIEHPVDYSSNYMILINSWNDLGSLNTLTLRFLQDSEEFDILDFELLKKLRPNYNLKAFNIKHQDFSIPMKLIMRIFKLTPNLSELYLTKLTTPLVTFIAKHFKLLRKLSYSYIDADCEGAYNQLKQESDTNKIIVLSKNYLG